MPACLVPERSTGQGEHRPSQSEDVSTPHLSGTTSPAALPIQRAPGTVNQQGWPLAARDPAPSPSLQASSCSEPPSCWPNTQHRQGWSLGPWAEMTGEEHSQRPPPPGWGDFPIAPPPCLSAWPSRAARSRREEHHVKSHRRDSGSSQALSTNSEPIGNPMSPSRALCSQSTASPFYS